MKARKLTHVLIVLSAPLCLAQGGGLRQATLYGGRIDYGSASLKDTANAFGVYANVDSSARSTLELAIDSLDIDFRDGSSLDQTDYTAIHSAAAGSETTWRLGGHYLSSDDALTDGGWTLILTEKHTDGWGAEARYALSSGTTLSARVVRESFEDLGSPAGTESTTCLLLLERAL